MLRAAGLAAALALAGGAQAQESVLGAEMAQRLQSLAQSAALASLAQPARVEVELGTLDPRLRLAPCRQIQAYVPNGAKMWGRTRLGVRCLEGERRWNVSLPLRVKVFAKAWAAVADLPAGTELTQDKLRWAEVDIAGDGGAVFGADQAPLGRTLVRTVAAGEPVRSGALKLRQWFGPGERVLVMAVGTGYAISSEGQAMGVGLEGQEVRVRFDNGRVAVGRAVAERRVEVLL